jgi:N-acetyl-gamma-glutamyl-phosphate reductase
MTSRAKSDTSQLSVFIDGEAGTTGLQIRERLAALADVEVRSIDPALRKDEAARLDMMRNVDLVVLCLPDDAAKEAVALADTLGNDAPKIVDASTAHRVAPEWVYGFAELDAKQTDAIRHAKRVSNPGCYPTGAIALLRPLIAGGVVAPDHPITVNAVSGYSGGGKSMIESYEVSKTAPTFELYGLGLDHKHVPELMAYSGLTRRPIFVPSVGNFRQGMLVSIPLHLDLLPSKPSAQDIHKTLAQFYVGSERVHVMPYAIGVRIEPEALNNSDQLELFVYGNKTGDQAVLVARLDNLGKGAAGAAVQNLQLMLGLDTPSRA